MPVSSHQSAIIEFSKIACKLTGIQLDERHWEMIRSRLQRRFRELKLSSLEDYLSYYYANEQEEAQKIMGLLTTHHTSFFREFGHFEFLLTQALPALLPEVRLRPNRTIRVWSAACSRGQEVYSLAMFLKLHLERLDPSINFEIVGTDVDAESVKIAKNGVYLRKELQEVPMTLLGDHWIRGTGEISDYTKVKNSLQKHCYFMQANLLELKKEAPLGKFDLIFCRNIFIYFSPEQIRQVCGDLFSKLNSYGFFFAGISESLVHLNLPILHRGPSIYQVKSETKPLATKPVATSATAYVPAPTPVPVQAATKKKPIRVLCVDDSETILVLLKKILTQEEGFEIVGTAKNGEEAAKKMTELFPDMMTLDIHMPVMTGIEYLEKYHNKNHPPVVMVTSVSRDDSKLAGQSLSLGAADFVEKPALSNLEEKGDEIRTKLRCTFVAHQLAFTANHSLDRSFQRKQEIANPSEKVRMFVMSLSHRGKVRALLNALSGPQPPTVLLLSGAKDNMPALADMLSKEFSRVVQYSDRIPESLETGSCYLLDLNSQADVLASGAARGKKISISVFGEVSKLAASKVLSFQGAQLLLEEIGNQRGTETLMEAADDVTPGTSFVYLSDEYFSRDGAGGKKAA